MTKDEAIATLVEQDVQKWGEAERAASHEMHASKTLGQALCQLYSRAELAGDTAAAAILSAAANASLTRADRRWLKTGG